MHLSTRKGHNCASSLHFFKSPGTGRLGNYLLYIRTGLAFYKSRAVFFCSARGRVVPTAISLVLMVIMGRLPLYAVFERDP